MIEVTDEMVHLVYERIDFVDHGDDGIREGLAAVFALIEAKSPATLHCDECTVDEDPRPWCDCVDGEQCRGLGPCRKRAHHPSNCPTLATEWIGSTFLHIVTGDRVRIGQEEADVTQTMVQPWHARDGEWVPSGQKKADGTDKMMKTVIKDDHWEVRAVLDPVASGESPFPFSPPHWTPVEILCTPARKAQLALSHAGFIGTTEI